MTKKIIARITGDNAKLLEMAMDKGMDLKFERDDESGDITILVG